MKAAISVTLNSVKVSFSQGVDTLPFPSPKMISNPISKTLSDISTKITIVAPLPGESCFSLSIFNKTFFLFNVINVLY